MFGAIELVFKYRVDSAQYYQNIGPYVLPVTEGAKTQSCIEYAGK
jgi:hypothetical protein